MPWYVGRYLEGWGVSAGVLFVGGTCRLLVVCLALVSILLNPPIGAAVVTIFSPQFAGVFWDILRGTIFPRLAPLWALFEAVFWVWFR